MIDRSSARNRKSVLGEKENDMTENDVTYECQVADLPEAKRLRDAIRDAMFAYQTFLEDHGLVWKEDLADDYPLKAQKLIAEINFEYPDCGQVVDIRLAGGALDRAIAINRSTMRAGQNQVTEP
jgi:hypothetical protein